MNHFSYQALFEQNISKTFFIFKIEKKPSVMFTLVELLLEIQFVLP